MQIRKITDSLVPVTLAAGIAANPFVYSSIDMYSGIETTLTNNQILEYISSVDDHDSAETSQLLKFKLFLENWENETMFLSSPRDIVENDNFKSMVSMGKSAVPFILNEISAKPSNLVWALNFIFGTKITNNPRATVEDACKLWVKKLMK